MKKPAPENASMLAGSVSAVGASACCTLPFVLVSLGLGGAWVAQLGALARFFPVFVGIAVAAFAFGFYRLYIRRPPCEPSSACPTPKTQRRQRVAFWAALLFASALIAFPYLYV